MVNSSSKKAKAAPQLPDPLQVHLLPLACELGAQALTESSLPASTALPVCCRGGPARLYRAPALCRWARRRTLTLGPGASGAPARPRTAASVLPATLTVRPAHHEQVGADGRQQSHAPCACGQRPEPVIAVTSSRRRLLPEGGQAECMGVLCRRAAGLLRTAQGGRHGGRRQPQVRLAGCSHGPPGACTARGACQAGAHASGCLGCQRPVRLTASCVLHWQTPISWASVSNAHLPWALAATRTRPQGQEPPARARRSPLHWAPGHAGRQDLDDPPAGVMACCCRRPGSTC